MVERDRGALGWRLVVYLLLLLSLSVVGQLLTAVFPPAMRAAASMALMLAAALAAGWAVLAYMDHRPAGALGFAISRAAAAETARGIGVGAALIGINVLLLLVTGTARFVPDAGTPAEYLATLLTTFAFFAAAAAWEEVVFRGYAFQAVVEAAGVWPATLVSAAVFALAHGGNPGATSLGLANIFLAGVLLAVAYLRTRSLWFATAVHLGWNWAMATLLGFPVSGWDTFDTPLYDARETGADWWTGGSFGPEAGLAATIVLLAGTVWMLWTPRLREAPEMRALCPLVDRRLAGKWRYFEL